MANTTWSTTDKAASTTISGGNLVATATSVAAWVRAVDKQVSGKFYWEVTTTTFNNNTSEIGIVPLSAIISGGLGSAGTGGCGLTRVGTIRVDGVNVVTGFGSITSGTVFCIAVDLTARLIWFRLGAAGNWNNATGNNPATGIGGVSIPSLGAGIPAVPAFLGGVSLESGTANFGDSAFVGSVPSGFTSGFTSGATSSTNVVATQVGVEEWITTNAQAQVTQVAIEEWAAWDQILQIGGAIRENLIFNPGDVQIGTVAREVLLNGTGVSRQFLLGGIVREALVRDYGRLVRSKFARFVTDDELISDGKPWYPLAFRRAMPSPVPIVTTGLKLRPYFAVSSA